MLLNTGRLGCCRIFSTILPDADFRRTDAGSMLDNTDSHGTGVDLIDPESVLIAELTAPYDTVWQAGLLVKLARSLPPKVAHIVEFLLKNRMFRASTSVTRSVDGGLKNGPLGVNKLRVSRTRPAGHDTQPPKNSERE